MICYKNDLQLTVSDHVGQTKTSMHFSHICMAIWQKRRFPLSPFVSSIFHVGPRWCLDIAKHFVVFFTVHIG